MHRKQHSSLEQTTDQPHLYSAEPTGSCTARSMGRFEAGRALPPSAARAPSTTPRACPAVRLPCSSASRCVLASTALVCAYGYTGKHIGKGSIFVCAKVRLPRSSASRCMLANTAVKYACK